MNYFETINKMKSSIKSDMHVPKDVYLEIEAEIVKAVGDYITNAEVSCVSYGTGKIISYTGNTLEDLIVDIQFTDVVKRFSLVHIMNNKFIKIESISEIKDAWDSASEVHTAITAIHKECERILRQQELEAQKKAEADKKAEAKYQKQKEKALNDFEMLSNRTFEASTDNDFYYALGWLAKHVGTVSAALPDYLADAFAKYFGADTPCRVVDSKHRGPAGWQSQWSWSFSATLKKAETVPAILQQYLNPKGKAITDTSFVWDLIDNYGFKFGKEQDVEQIAKTVPAKYIDSFNEGLSE
jgi:hypothetical protein